MEQHMSDWTSGYVADIGYTYGYYPELNPIRLILAFLNQGLVAPEVGAACELGFGQGLSANIHAAASVTQWHGTDFNPSQASFARELAAASGANAHFFDESFAEFCSRLDLPDFDYIGLHGIWSWISDGNRHVIVDFIRRKLKVGGVLYISYNTLPGWAAFAPMRHLMTEHAQTMGTQGLGIVSRIDGAIDFAEQLLATNPMYSRANPQVAERIKTLKGHSRHYLAHEYFNRDWQPMHFGTMADWLKQAKMDFACSADYLDHVETVHLTADQQKLLLEIPDKMFRETVRDFLVNQQFRKDYWVKGARKLSTLEQTEALRNVRVLLTSDAADVTLKINGTLGEATLSENVYLPIVGLLSDHEPKTIGQIEETLKPKNVTFAYIVQAVMVLSHAGHLAVVQSDTVSAASKAKAEKLNKYLCSKARSSQEIAYLVSPVTGGGYALGRFQQLFLLNYMAGNNAIDDWASAVWQLLSSQGQKLVKEGKALETPEENLAELTAQAQIFSDKLLPILKALQIA
jgi:SAM-dependent methyltransferase